MTRSLALPQALKVPCVVAGERRQDNLRVAQLRFSGLSEAVVELLDKLIFRHHRRLEKAGRGASRGPGGPPSKLRSVAAVDMVNQFS